MFGCARARASSARSISRPVASRWCRMRRLRVAALAAEREAAAEPPPRRRRAVELARRALSSDVDRRAGPRSTTSARRPRGRGRRPASSVSRTCSSKESSSASTAAMPPCAQLVAESAAPLLGDDRRRGPCSATRSAKKRPAMSAAEDQEVEAAGLVGGSAQEPGLGSEGARSKAEAPTVRYPNDRPAESTRAPAIASPAGKTALGGAGRARCTRSGRSSSPPPWRPLRLRPATSTAGSTRAASCTSPTRRAAARSRRSRCARRQGSPVFAPSKTSGGSLLLRRSGARARRSAGHEDYDPLIRASRRAGTACRRRW